MKLTILFLLAFIFALSLNGCGYNTMQANEEAVIAAWGDVDAAYQRRADLIPNLVQITREYAAHEKDTLIAVTDARSRIISFNKTKTTNNQKAFNDFNAAQGELSSALSRLLVIVEQYPALKADSNFRALQSQLEGTENRINIARIRYNDTVFAFNTSIRTFPNNIINKLLLDLKSREPYKADTGASKAPVIEKK